jgi:two-component system response regulator PilR (NtrC family)
LVATLALADRFAEREAPVLLLGESGTGKELMAQRIHNHSLRSSGPFVPINCGSTPESLWESEWFGYRKGAFSGADCDREGLILSAHRGTLFLDEIGEMPLTAQARLLRVLQEKCVKPLGSTREIPVDFRLVAATHRPLFEKVEKGEFRLDLFYRIQVLELELPPLRERPGDAPLIFQRWLEEAWGIECARSVTYALRGVLLNQPFPGNIRELKNCAERIMALGPQAGFQNWLAICGWPIPSEPKMKNDDSSQKNFPQEANRPLFPPNSRVSDSEILSALEACGNHRRLTSEKLGMTRRALQYRLARWAQ